MPLETATYINDLNPNNPAGSDSQSAGDDHLRMIKQVLKNTFPGVTAPVSFTSRDVDTALNVATTTIPATVQFIRTAGYTTLGDPGYGLYKRVGAEPSHNGKLQSADGAWWELVPENGYVRPEQFGAIANNVFDCHTAIMSAIEMISIHAAGDGNASYGVILSGPDYFVGQMILLKAGVHFLGRGAGLPGAAPTNLRFPANVTGIQVNRKNTSGATTTGNTTAADGAIIEGIHLIGGSGTVAGVTDRTKGHGIDLRARALIRNVFIDLFAGNGINIVATAGSGGATEGNANNWRVEGVRCQRNGMSGLYCDGADVNAGYAIGLDCSSNGRWGIWDSSFLGNTYVAPHVANNGVANVGLNGAGQSSFVSFGGNRYSANVAASLADLVATTPGTDENVWIFTLAGGTAANIPLWTAAQPVGTYFHGGSYHTDNLNARNAFLGVYQESGQALAQLSRPTIFFGGIFGSISPQSDGAALDMDQNGALQNRTGFSSRRTTPTTGNIVTSRIGTAGNSEDILYWDHSADGALDGVWRLVRSGNDYVINNRNLGTRIAARLTGVNTTEQMGTGVAQPFLFSMPRMALGSGANMRRQTTGTAAPASDTWARGDIVWNVSPSAGGKVGWVCVTAGTPGTWKPFGAIDP